MAFSEPTLVDLRDRIRDIPLVLEGLVWLAFFPYVLGLAFWDSGWSEPLRFALVACCAIGWSLAFFRGGDRSRERPTRGGGDGRASLAAGCACHHRRSRARLERHPGTAMPATASRRNHPVMARGLARPDSLVALRVGARERPGAVLALACVRSVRSPLFRAGDCVRLARRIRAGGPRRKQRQSLALGLTATARRQARRPGDARFDPPGRVSG